LSELGRWLNRDPEEEEYVRNLYLFLNNESLGLIDYLGLYPQAYPVPLNPGNGTPNDPVVTEVDRRVRQRRPGNTWDWQSKFELTVDDFSCTAKVKVRIKIDAKGWQNVAVNHSTRAYWKREIEKIWSKKVCCCCPSKVNVCKDGIVCLSGVEVDFTDTDPHFTIRVPRRNREQKMRSWSTDTVEINAHEFGHMIGATDQYGMTTPLNDDGSEMLDASGNPLTYDNETLMGNLYPDPPRKGWSRGVTPDDYRTICKAIGSGCSVFKP
jgi:hypothetical protein